MNRNFQKVISLIRENRWNSIFFQFLKKIFIYMLIPFTVIFIVIYAFFVNSLENDFEKLIGNSLQKNCTSVSEVLMVCDNHYLDLAFSQQILNLLSSNYLENPSIVEKNISYFTKGNTKILHTSPAIKNIVLYSKLNDHISRSGVSADDGISFRDTAWFQAYKKEEGKNRNIFMIPSGKNSFIRCYKIFEGKKYLGCLMFEIDPSIQRNASGETQSILDNIIMIDKEGTVFYNKSINTSTINDEFVEEAFSKETLLKKDSNSFIYSQRSYNSDYIIISVSNRSHMSNTMRTFYLSFFGIVIMMIVSLLFISIYLSSYVYNSISKITGLLQSSPNYNNKNSNEIYYITQQILSVVNDRNNIEKELTDKINQLKKAQITALNTQISPHFVFNTLNLVNAIIMNIIKKPNDAEKVVGILADSFYYSLRNENYIVDIGDEILYTKKFIEIEHIKLEGNFDVSFDVEPDVYNCKVLKFMLQPLAENSFSHGISKLTDRRGIIKINIFKDIDTLVCKVFDNGNKVDDEKIDSVNQRLNAAVITEDNEHIGLNNVNTRIRLIWGNSYGCFIESDISGTTVTVRIPFIEN